MVLCIHFLTTYDFEFERESADPERKEGIFSKFWHGQFWGQVML